MEDTIKQENEWDDVVDAEHLGRPVPEITMDEIKKALKSMKRGKSSDPFGA